MKYILCSFIGAIVVSVLFIILCFLFPGKGFMHIPLPFGPLLYCADLIHSGNYGILGFTAKITHEIIAFSLPPLLGVVLGIIFCALSHSEEPGS